MLTGTFARLFLDSHIWRSVSGQHEYCEVFWVHIKDPINENTVSIASGILDSLDKEFQC